MADDIKGFDGTPIPSPEDTREKEILAMEGAEVILHIEPTGIGNWIYRETIAPRATDKVVQLFKYRELFDDNGTLVGRAMADAPKSIVAWDYDPLLSSPIIVT